MSSLLNWVNDSYIFRTGKVREVERIMWRH